MEQMTLWPITVEHSAATEDETSTPCWKKLRVSQNQDFLYLDCRKSGNGQKQEPLTVMGGLSLGELTTLRTGEKPSETAVQEMLSVWGPHSVAEESRLSQILEETPHPKYNLTAKACQGILRRAERRGKDLPKLLKAVLIRQSQGASPQERTEAPAPTEAPTSYAVRIRGGCDRGGKGALVQTEKSGTLGTGNDQTIFAATPINLMVATRCKALGRGTGFGVGEPGDPANTISAAHSHGVFCAGFKAGQGAQAGGIGYGEEVSPTLAAVPSGTNQTPAVMCLNDQGGNVMGVSHDVSGTLRAQEHGHQPAVMAFAQNQREEVRNVGDKAVSLAAEVGMHCQTFVALDMSHACDVIRDCGEVAPSLQARMGTGGNQIPLTYQDVTGTLSPGAHAGSYNGQDAYNDMLVCGATPDVARAILYQPKSAMEENWAASETKNALRAGESKVSHAVMCEDVSHALRANGACAYREDAETYPVQNMVVRRLTPMECERLQGFPDGWTDIGEWRDSRGKLRKPSDSPRYKALGNSIALPFWDFLAKRISAQYIRPVTMGSLFDGIGGFPLVFERHNGKGTARWASEIEEFPIAVTKLRFGGEDNGSQEVLLAEAEA